MRFDGAFAEAQFSRYNFVRKTETYQIRDLPFANSQHAKLLGSVLHIYELGTAKDGGIDPYQRAPSNKKKPQPNDRG